MGWWDTTPSNPSHGSILNVTQISKDHNNGPQLQVNGCQPRVGQVDQPTTSDLITNIKTNTKHIKKIT